MRSLRSAATCAVAVVATLASASCTTSSGAGVDEPSSLSVVSSAVVISAPPAPSEVPSQAASTTAEATTSTTGPSTTSTTGPSTTLPPTVPPTIAPPTTEATTTPYAVPLVNAQSGGWGDTHAAYPATDLFENGCGNGIVSPVNGSLLEVRRINSYDEVVDNPATRGGRSVSILGDDGVRYYLAHFEEVDAALAVGGRVAVGQFLGTIGTTGRSSACHLHFGISPPCPDREWSVRRGVVWPFRYLDDWQQGGQLSPVDEVAAWAAAHPNACADAAADPFAPDA